MLRNRWKFDKDWFLASYIHVKHRDKQIAMPCFKNRHSFDVNYMFIFSEKHPFLFINAILKCYLC